MQTCGENADLVKHCKRLQQLVASDSTIAPPQNQRFSLTNERVFMAVRHKEGYN